MEPLKGHMFTNYSMKETWMNIIRRHLVSTTERCQYTPFLKFKSTDVNLLWIVCWTILHYDWSDQITCQSSSSVRSIQTAVLFLVCCSQFKLDSNWIKKSTEFYMSAIRMFILYDTEFRWHFTHIPLVLMNVTHELIMTSGSTAQVRECLSFQACTSAFEPFQGQISSWMFCCIHVEFNIWPRE